MRRRHSVYRTAAASVLALALAAAPACVYAQDTVESSVEEGIESVLEASGEALDGAVQEVQGTAYECSALLRAEDPLRAAIAQNYGSADDMAWIESAEIFLQTQTDDSGNPAAEATLMFNETELYHLVLSYDAAAQVLYAVCPEMQEQVMAIPAREVGSAAQDAVAAQVPAEVIEYAQTVVQDAMVLVQSIPADVLAQDLMGYVQTLAGHVTADQGIASVTAGTLSEESNTVTYKITSEDMQQLIPELLQLLSQDQILEQVMGSDFFTDLISLGMMASGAQMELSGADLYQQVSAMLEQMAQGDFSDMFGFMLSLGTNAAGMPDHVGLSLEYSGITAEIASIDFISSGYDHAAELKLGPVVAENLGLDSSSTSGFLVQGSSADGYLNEAFSLNLNGNQVPVFVIRDLDIEKLAAGILEGSFSVTAGGSEYTFNIGKEEETGRTFVEFCRNGDLWCTLTLDAKKVESTDIDPIDTQNAVTVSSEEEFAAYMRNANVNAMLEKLADAGVPQEYVDMLTSGEASTESSRENTEETGDAA